VISGVTPPAAAKGPGEGAQRDWGKYGPGSAVAGWLIAFFPAIVPAAFVLWCLGHIWGIGTARKSQPSHVGT
jgi:hypothetical protein